MVVVHHFNSRLTSLPAWRLLQFSTALTAATPTNPVLKLTMSSRRSARLSARVQVEAAVQDAPSAGKATRSPPATKSRKRKAPPAEEEVPAEAPATPKRPATKTAVPSPPSAPTATPSAVRLIAEPASTAVSTPKPKPRAVAQLADPNLTNAPLLSPETSRVVSYNPTTTANILEEACAHLIKGKSFPATTARCRRMLCVTQASILASSCSASARPPDPYLAGSKPIHYRAITMSLSQGS